MVETEGPLREQLPESQSSFAGMLPGPALAGELAGLPLDGLDDFALVEAMRAARRLTAWAESLELAAIAELERRRDLEADRYGAWTVEMERALCDEVSAALTLSGTAAAIRLGVADKLHHLLPDTRQALEQGRIDAAKARVICDGILGVSAELAREVERLVLPDAPRLTTRQLAARVRLAIMETDPEAFEQRRKTAEKGRRLEQYANPDGTSDLAVRDVPADAAEAACNNVNALAAAIKTDGDERPIDAIRADVALDLMRGRHPADPPRTTATPGEPTPVDTDEPAPGSRRSTSAPPESIPAGTTAGDTAPDVSDTGRQEATEITRMVREELTELLGQARDLNGSDENRLLILEAARRVGDALTPLKVRRCRITAGGDGHIVHGHDGYRPPAGMRRLIQTRNGTCTFPTCRQKAAKCDLDHTVPFHKGGPTCPCNIAPLCRGHHRLKQHPDWTLIQLWPGVLLWISPTGHWYVVGPDP